MKQMNGDLILDQSFDVKSYALDKSLDAVKPPRRTPCEMKVPTTQTGIKLPKRTALNMSQISQAAMSGVSSFMNSSYLHKNVVESAAPIPDLMKVNDFNIQPENENEVEITQKDLHEPIVVVAVPVPAPVTNKNEEIKDETPQPRLSAAQII